MNKYIYVFLAMLLHIQMISVNGMASIEDECPCMKKNARHLEASHLDVTDFRIIQKSSSRSIAIYEKFQDVIDRFGMPPKIYHPNEGDPTWTCLEYDSFSIYYYTNLYNQNILLVKVFDSSFSTVRNISIGNRLNKVFNTYSNEEITMLTTNLGEKFVNLKLMLPVKDYSNQPPFHEYSIDLRFFYENEIITRIEMEFYDEI